MSNMSSRRTMKHMKGNQRRIRALVGAAYGDIGNTYITPSIEEALFTPN